MFERFTTHGRDAVVNAQAEARALRHGYIGTEHILLGLLTSGGAATKLLKDFGADRDHVRRRIVEIVGEGSLATSDADALRTIGIDLDEVRRNVEETFGPGALEWDRIERTQRKRWWQRSRRCGDGHVPFTPRAKKVLELALREALRLKDQFLGTEHILLGLLREGEGAAAMLLVELDVGYDRVLNRLKDERGLSAS